MSSQILVIDDDPAILEAITVILQDEGYNVNGSVSGDYLYSLKPPYPHIILLDIWLSGHNGADLLSFLRAKEDFKNIPVVMISANRNLEQIAKDYGATGYLSKPFDIEDLLTVVRSLL